MCSAYPPFPPLSVTGQFEFSHSCQWWVASLAQVVPQRCPGASYGLIFVFPHSSHVNASLPPSVQLVATYMMPSSQRWGTPGVLFPQMEHSCQWTSLSDFHSHSWEQPPLSVAKTVVDRMPIARPAAASMDRIRFRVLIASSSCSLIKNCGWFHLTISFPSWARRQQKKRPPPAAQLPGRFH